MKEGEERRCEKSGFVNFSFATNSMRLQTGSGETSSAIVDSGFVVTADEAESKKRALRSRTETEVGFTLVRNVFAASLIDRSCVCAGWIETAGV